MRTKTILLKCKSKSLSGPYLYYVTDEKKTAGLFYMQREWTDLREMQCKPVYKRYKDMFTPEAVYPALHLSFDIIESSWLELLVVTGHTKEQLLSKLYKGQQHDKGLPSDKHTERDGK